MHSFIFRLLAGLALLLGFARADEPLVLAHYMPWYATKDVSGAWGWHWTMGHFEPDRWKWEGQREVASHDYPLIGPYDSGDPHALEAQVLLMKFAGIDGVIVDWYGTKDFNDYAANHRHTEALLPLLKKAGLRIAICYEDQAVGAMVKGKGIPADGAVAHGKEELRWLDEHWFADDAYVKQDGRPLLLVFGPQYFQREQWSELRAGLKSQPLIFALPHLAKSSGADGAFGWPPVEGGKTLTPEQWRKELNTLYARRTAGEQVIATAFPGFHDIYKQAGVSNSYGSIAERDGATFAETLDLALQSGAPITQLATWNDYGEGTVIEPTRSNGYRYLEAVQARKAKRFTAADLRLPVALYQLRKRAAGDADATRELDAAAALLFAAKTREADATLAKVSARLAKQPAVFAEALGAPDANYHLATDIPYRTGDDLTDGMMQRCRLDVYAPANKRGFATVVWFHGGGLTKGERSIPLGLRNKGVAVVSVNYRLSPGVNSPAFLEDAAAAVAWTFQNIASYGGSPDSIFVSGHSAGAYLAAMLGLDKRWLAAQSVDADRIAGLIPLSPQTITHFAIRKERGIDEKQPIIDDLAPLFHVRKDAPPVLVVTGDREKELMGRYEETAYFWRMLKLAGHRDVTLREMQGFDHGGMPEPAMPLLLRFVEEHRRK